MFEKGESTTRPPVLGALFLVGAAGVTGALVLPVGLMSLLVVGWAGGGGAALIVGVVIVALMVGVLVGAASLVPEVSDLTRTMGGRVGWALIVIVAGGFGWLFAYAVFREAMPGNTTTAAPLGAVPFALVAGLLLRPWYVKAVAAVLVVASGMGLLAVLAGAGPATGAGNAPSGLDARLAAAGLERDEVFVTDIPGYHRVPNQSIMEPDDAGAVPPNRYLTLIARPDEPLGDCEFTTDVAELAGAPCTVEQPGLTYTEGVAAHAYFHRRGTLLLQLFGALEVSRDTLRNAILAAVPTADPAIYTTHVDGYEGTVQGPPLGMYFAPVDKTQVPLAKYVEVSASRVPQAGTCQSFAESGAPSPYLECVAESPDLHYERLADKHVYYAQHGSMEVRLLGGLGVDRAVLRDAATTARPATDDELMSMLPPSPPAPEARTFMGRLKEFAHRVFG